MYLSFLYLSGYEYALLNIKENKHKEKKKCFDVVYTIQEYFNLLLIF